MTLDYFTTPDGRTGVLCSGEPRKDAWGEEWIGLRFVKIVETCVTFLSQGERFPKSDLQGPYQLTYTMAAYPRGV